MLYNFTSLLFDVAIIAIFVISIMLAAKKGAFRAISGIVGTIVGIVCGIVFQDLLAGGISSLFVKPVEDFLRSLDFSEFMELGADTVAKASENLAHVIEQWKQSNGGQIPEELVTTLSHIIVPELAAIVSFIVIFIVVKLIAVCILRLFNDKIPVFRTISKGLGVVLGAVSGLLIVMVLCWAVLHYAPVDAGAAGISQEALRDSYLGGFFCGLFR